MGKDFEYWVGYVGSAAMVAFLATCLNAPRVATFTCDTPPGASHEQCRLMETLPVHAEPAEVSRAEARSSDGSARMAVASRAVD